MPNENGFLKQICLRNFLSYGEEGQTLDLKPLNVFIGPNTSGKSNLIEALRLLRAATQKEGQSDLSQMLSKGGGVSEWIWKGKTERADAHIEIISDSLPPFPWKMRYILEFGEKDKKFELTREGVIRQKIETQEFKDHQPDYYYQIGSYPSLVTYVSKKDWEKIQKNPTISLGYANVEELDLNRSILSQRDDPEVFPNINYIANNLRKIKIYRNGDLSISSPVRDYQKTSGLPDFLEEDASNLFFVLNYLLEDTGTTIQINDYLRRFSKGFQEISPSVRGNEIQYFIRENGLADRITADHFSEGFLRYLCLLVILCHYDPPTMICIEEPELCMHPDILPVIAELLKLASRRTQLFVTTHSDHLVSALSDTPESVIVCNRTKSGTNLKRLDKDQLKDWLKKYTLGDLWTMGEIGGVT